MAERKIFQDSVVPLPVESGLTSSGLMVAKASESHQDETMSVLFSLAIPDKDQAELERRVINGEMISAGELNQNYRPDASDLSSLEKWLKDEGFTITKVTDDGTGVYALAKVSQIEKSLQVNMVRVTKDGLTYTAAQNPPSLPATVANSVHAIIGLQPFRQARKNVRMRAPKHGNRQGPKNSEINAPVPQATNTENAPPYLVSEIMKAYNADGLGLTGKGETIAILIDTVPADSDLKIFWKANSLPTKLSQVEKINVKGNFLDPPSGEETLDVQWSSGVAPDATIRVYASGTLEFDDLNRALDQIIEDVPKTPGLRQLSISLGLGETYMGGSDGVVAAQHQRFLRLIALGVNIFVSSGDAGSNPDSTGHNATGPLQAEHPSSDPFVTGVGGTSLHLSAAGAITKEDAWTGSGGGQSIFFDRPLWQKGSGIPASGRRLVPDVGLTADPDFGAYVMINGHVQQTGGTSWSAPVWAGFCALINEARITVGKPPLSFINPLIYPLLGSSAFRDISYGTNGGYQAAKGYDMITGVGVPNVRELIAALTS